MSKNPQGKESILTDIYLSKEVEITIKGIRPEHHQQDIKQHCFLELFEKDESFIMDLHSRGKLKSYICKVLYNTARFTRTTFSKQLGKEVPISVLVTSDSYDHDCSKYRSNRFFSDRIEDVADQEYEEINVDLKHLNWYKKEILELYAEHGTYQKVSDLTQIPLTSIYNTVLQTRKEILKKYYQDQKR